MSAPKSEKRRYIASRLVIEAFGSAAADAFLAVVIDAQELEAAGRLRVRGLRGEEHDLIVEYPTEVAEAFARDDLVHWRTLVCPREHRVENIDGMHLWLPDDQHLTSEGAVVVWKSWLPQLRVSS